MDEMCKTQMEKCYENPTQMRDRAYISKNLCREREMDEMCKTQMKKHYEYEIILRMATKGKEEEEREYLQTVER